MRSFENIIINFPGGIISPGHLYDVMEIAAAARVSHVRFGNRQQLLLDVPVKYVDTFYDGCKEKKITFSTGHDIAPNIVSSYAAAGIFIADTWLSEGVYKDIFDMFDYTPRLKLNICDSDQTFVPFFNGNINWVASKQIHFWHLYIRFPKTNKLYRLPELIYTNDIMYVSKAIEESLLKQPVLIDEDHHKFGDHLYQKIKNTLHPITKLADQELELPMFHLPYYEGFNKYANHYWLGIYRRNELFPVSFLKDICSVCLETKIGELYATTWKSIIIKSIVPEQRNLWDYLLGKYRINVRHAANELNWQVEDGNEDGLILKRHIIRYFDKEDVRTYGLCFAVKTKSACGIFGSVIVRKQVQKKVSRLKSAERYEILYTANFNPNSSEYILFRGDVEKDNLGVYLVSLCKMFYESKSLHNPLTETTKPLQQTVKAQPDAEIVYQCKHCLTIYNEAAGEPENNIAAGTAFKELKNDYSCPLCESPKEDFVVISDHHFVLSSL